MRLQVAQKHNFDFHSWGNICQEELTQDVDSIESKIKRLEVERYSIYTEKTVFWSKCFGQPSNIKIELPTERFKTELENYKKAKKQFIEQLPKLLKNHYGKFAAVSQGHIEIGDDRKSLRNLMIEKYGYTSMYMGKIGEKKRIIKDRRRPKLIKK